MSDPSEAHEANPHPASSHRSPHEIAKDAASRAGPKQGNPPEPPNLTDPEKERREAVQRGAHAPKKPTE